MNKILLFIILVGLLLFSIAYFMVFLLWKDDNSVLVFLVILALEYVFACLIAIRISNAPGAWALASIFILTIFPGSSFLLLITALTPLVYLAVVIIRKGRLKGKPGPIIADYFEVQGVAVRAAALLIDSALAFTLFNAFSFLDLIRLSLLIAFGTIISAIYFIFMEAIFGGTCGKLILGMRVILQNGKKCSLKAAVIRNLIRIPEQAAWYVPSALSVWLSSNRQRVGDLAAKTFVVRHKV